jgi:hypothetical protein
LEIGNKKVACPYFQNVAGKKISSPVFSGKGTPEEIQDATIKIFRQTGRNISNYPPDVIRFYMVMANIGIDCSGFVVRVIQNFLKETGRGDLRKNLRPENKSAGILLRFLIRPESNLSADSLTSKTNCVSVKKINDVLPGDLIRVGPSHVAIVGEVGKTGNKVRKIIYCHSTYDYFEKHGVRSGEIIIKNPQQDLSKQKWTEYYRGRNWMLEDYLNAKPHDRGLRRLKVFAKT